MSPSDVVKAQLTAYNARDIAAFMALWATDAEITAHPATLLARGHDAIRARHITRFAEPHLYAKLIHRTTVGHFVVDHELVTRDFPEGVGEIEVIGMYDVVGEKISKAWFVFGEKKIHGA